MYHGKVICSIQFEYYTLIIEEQWLYEPITLDKYCTKYYIPLAFEDIQAPLSFLLYYSYWSPDPRTHFN